MVADLTIRKMATADHPAVGAVGFAAWLAGNALDESYLRPEVIARVEREFLIFSSKIEGEIYVAEADGRLVGWTAREEDPCHISDVWVSPDWQGKGVGSALVSFLCDKMLAQGHRRATIHAHANNHRAIRAYERNGFRIVWRGIEYSTSMQVDLEKVHMEKLFEG